MPHLRRERDGAGDSGAMIQLLRLGADGQIETKFPKTIEDIEPGWAVRVGSIGARTYSSQDYWITTPITEILESTEDSVRFKTGNSVYSLEY